MVAATKGIFLSYASEDTEAARRICEALRAAGLEVWFDQSELRGGDAWDFLYGRRPFWQGLLRDGIEVRLQSYIRPTSAELGSAWP